MKLVAQVRLLPTPEEASALEATLRACNRAATCASQVAFAKDLKDRNGLQGVYGELKARFGLSAQPAVRAVKKVVDAYAALGANVRAGSLGPPTCKRYRAAVGTLIGFRPQAAQPFDDRCLSWQYDARTVSIWTVAGRMRGIRFACSPDQLEPRHHIRWHELPGTAPVPLSAPTGPQTRRTPEEEGRSARRRLARRRRKEQRHATHVNHRISKEIVSVAQRTGRGIAVEALGGIRERVRLRRDQRGTLSSWPFRQLGAHLAYKARRAGVPFLEVDAAYTSQRCPRCGHTERANRPDRDHFHCRRRGQRA
ncbi:IS200/IS605 family accessory protein TnpB-related protein [Streptomyces sp. NPDC059679]|uniref:IS200/IS605 family accessory protein TnpB-related protein n=1 Tax=Streptomyces sp. NPDC059679 TaxID=3346903 RepID=UPI00369A5070